MLFRSCGVGYLSLGLRITVLLCVLVSLWESGEEGQMSFAQQGSGISAGASVPWHLAGTPMTPAFGIQPLGLRPQLLSEWPSAENKLASNSVCCELGASLYTAFDKVAGVSGFHITGILVLVCDSAIPQVAPPEFLPYKPRLDA